MWYWQVSTGNWHVLPVVNITETRVHKFTYHIGALIFFFIQSCSKYHTYPFKFLFSPVSQVIFKHISNLYQFGTKI